MTEQRMGIIVLAAGASLRMGTPKQLLPIGGVPLIRRAAQSALDSHCRPVVVVLGANAELIRPELAGLELHIAINDVWQRGMSTSIHTGLSALQAMEPALMGVILMVADQPKIQGVSLQRLARAHALTGATVVAARYAGQLGTPAFFSRDHFSELLQLEGEQGAKSLLKHHANCLMPLDFPEAAFDLDTPEDVASLGW